MREKNRDDDFICVCVNAGKILYCMYKKSCEKDYHRPMYNYNTKKSNTGRL
jgi:hypothetical protein